jgi:hypothetical protein
MAKTNILRKVSKFYAKLVFVCLLFLVLGHTSLVLSETNFEEHIEMDIVINENIPTYADVSILINFFAIKRMSNYTSVFMNENFKYVQISWEFRRYKNTLFLSVVFDSSKISSIEEGRTIAERIMKDTENVWGIKLSYQGYNVIYGSIQGQDFNETSYNYMDEEEYPLQMLKTILLHYCPAEGFGKILHSMTFWENVNIILRLELDEKCNPVWNIFVTLRYNKCLLIEPDQKCTVSFKNLTGYAEPIQSSPDASHSYLFMSIDDTAVLQYTLKAQSLTENMRAGWEFDSFSQDIKGVSVSDLALIFSYFIPSTTRSTITLILMIGAFAAVLIIISVFIVRMKNRTK